MKIASKIWWLPLVAYMLIMPSFMSAKVYDVACRKVDINITDSSTCGFVTGGMLLSMIHNDDHAVLGRPICEVSISELEKRISSLRELESVEIYFTADGILHVDADQRDPVVRIITSFNNSYYIDGKGVIMPGNPFYTPRVPVVTGEIIIADSLISKGTTVDLPRDAGLVKILRLVEYIGSSDLWSGQFEQIYVDGRGEISLVPRVGNHIIKFGQAENIENKLGRLRALYTDALPALGWNSYREINLVYDGQVVCKKR